MDCDHVTSHQKIKDSSPIITSFFKIMFGGDHSKVMILPPDFARTVKHLAGREIQIEDSEGQRWSVALSYDDDGYLAFQTGWEKFYKDHNLETGQVLVFHCIKKGHFVVHVYGRNACEKIIFNSVKSLPNKRSRSNSETVSEVGLSKKVHVSSIDKSSSATSAASESKPLSHPTPPAVTNADIRRKLHPYPIHKSIEDPICIINSDDGDKGKDRDFLSDLSIFEMEYNTKGANEFGKALDSENAYKSEEVRDLEAVSCQMEITDPAQTKQDGVKMPTSSVDVVNSNAVGENVVNVPSDKLENVLDPKTEPSDTDTVDQPKIKEDYTKMVDVCADNGHESPFEKLDTKVTPYVETRGQRELKRDDIKMTKYHTEELNDRPGDFLSTEFPTKPFGDSTAGCVMPDHVSDSKNGIRRVRKSTSEWPSIGKGTTTERKRTSSFKSSVPRPVMEDLPGKRSIKKKVLKLEPETSDYPSLSRGQEPNAVKKHGRLSSQAVELDPSHQILSFSAEVKSLSYLEIPVHIPPAPGRRERSQGSVVYLKGSTGDLWPLLYPDVPCSRVLTGNWKRFCKNNNIKVGDKCSFEAECEVPCVFTVSITE